VAERVGRWPAATQPRPVADVQALRVVKLAVDRPGGQHRHILFPRSVLI
jgi:hypothetical protein